METKKCPKCGAEIPVEMSFCLHCMERTDGVLEIKKKAVPSRKFIAEMISVFVVMAAAIILLILLMTMKNDSENKESQLSSETTEKITETTSDVITDFYNDTQDSPSEHSPELEDISSNEPSQKDKGVSLEINFEERFTERLNAWGASHVLTDTLSFSENGCTFTSNVGTDKVNCTVSSNSDMTDFTLIIEPSTEYTRYSAAVYIPDIVNEITYFVLDYRMSSSIRTDIGLMFENFESEGSFSENELTCNISTQAHNNGSYPITVNCSIV